MSEILETLRAQCRIDTDDDAEDNLLLLYFGAARKKAENLTNRKLYDSESDVPETDPYGLVIEDDILLALLLLVGHWYENREQVNVGNIVTTFPFGFDSLLEPYRLIPL
ncbi:head-tail connector protein [Enterobacter asburiae]|uniref:head-tail connector protein n=1 Tax=Enterobacter asburiae TaxID=61645 RepID=UPI002005FE6C|nr:head-tail connector protein [Enterobacter asburiae]MCK6678252.1 head-tail connector protein [Enterobacter asburiae]